MLEGLPHLRWGGSRMSTLVVDGNNLLARAAFAAKGGRTEMSVDGVNTSALLLFINMISKYVRQVRPTHMAVCWDAGHIHRDRIYPGYKASRGKSVVDTDLEGEEEAVTPWQQAKEFCTWAGIPHIARRGHEADDLISLIAHDPRTAKPVTVLSGDKDLLQLVCDDVVQIRPGTQANEVWDTRRVIAEMGLHPSQIPLYMALTGDAGDGVPGVRGIGPKKALKALEEANWEWTSLLDALGPEKAQEAVTSRLLVDLITAEYAAYAEDGLLALSGLTAPEFTPTAPGGMLWEPLQDFLQKWQMNSVIARLTDGSLWFTGGSADASSEAFAGFDL